MTFSEIADGILLACNESDSPLIFDVQSALDLIAATWDVSDSGRLVIMKDDISEAFFDLKTGIAGEILQKFVNYNFRIAIVGDFSSYISKSLKDFIYESNKGKVINFMDSVENAAAVLEAV